MRQFALVTCLLAALSGGCATAELGRDQDKLRGVVLDLYTNQIIDNLIRASDGMPIIHMDYGTITGNVTAKETAGFNGSQEVDTTTARNTFATIGTNALVTFTKLFKTVYAYSTTGEHTNQVSMVGTPVNNADEVYEAYFQYLNFPNALLVSDKRPPECDVHICRKYCGKWYWVPVERKKEFLQLAMATTATRGKRLIPIAESFAVQLLEIVSEKEATFAPGATTFTLKLDKAIPNDEGRIELTLDKNTYSFLLDKSDVNVDKVNTLTITINPARYKDEPKFQNKFEGFRKTFPIPAKVILESHRPQPPTTKELIDGISNQLQIIQLNQLR